MELDGIHLPLFNILFLSIWFFYIFSSSYPCFNSAGLFTLLSYYSADGTQETIYRKPPVSPASSIISWLHLYFQLLFIFIFHHLQNCCYWHFPSGQSVIFRTRFFFFTYQHHVLPSGCNVHIGDILVLILVISWYISWWYIGYLGDIYIYFLVIHLLSWRYLDTFFGDTLVVMSVISWYISWWYSYIVDILIYFLVIHWLLSLWYLDIFLGDTLIVSSEMSWYISWWYTCPFEYTLI